ncbi:hypothetical protein M231_03681 [Tremella mesenterica]|uniref:Major facilitator superfamily (MFS) profile domain-containing protein n=1 Tax=Tremella mesenterica TaxID=5217 RepID=A0A4V1M442_TREME|nr:hypothetical protein M231_03681 [Tremella mesenterica]
MKDFHMENSLEDMVSSVAGKCGHTLQKLTKRTTILVPIALGWFLEKRLNLAIPLITTFILGLGNGAVLVATVYGQHLLPDKTGGMSASLNLVRCILGAIGTAVVQQMYDALGAGWTCIVLSGISTLGIPMLLLVKKRGRKWREKQERKLNPVTPSPDP